MDEQREQTRIVVTDRRVIISGHSWNRTACVAISAAVQTFARVSAMLGLLSAKVEVDTERGFYDVQLADLDEARLAIAGFVASGYGISQVCPGALLLADERRNPPNAVVTLPQGEQGTASFATSVEMPAVAPSIGLLGAKRLVVAG